MKKGFIIAALAVGVAGALAVTAVKYAPTLSKLKNFSSNISVKPLFEKIHGITKTNALRVYLKVAIKNFTGFDIEIKNLFANVFASKDNGATWYEVADSPNRINSIGIKDGASATGKMAVDIIPSAISSITNKQVLFKVVSTFDFQGVQTKIESNLDLTAARNGAASTITNFLNSNSSLTKGLKNLLNLKGAEPSASVAAFC